VAMRTPLRIARRAPRFFPLGSHQRAAQAPIPKLNPFDRGYGVAVLFAIASGLLAGYNIASAGLGQNGWGEGYLGGYALCAAVTFEFVATLLFVIVILGSRSRARQPSSPGWPSD